MNIGLFFGSFNPVHTGHLIIANHILNETDLDLIWLVVSPQNPFKSQSELLNELDRFNLVEKAVSNDKRIVASKIEFSMSRPSYTINTLNFLKEKYPSDNFTILMGSDTFNSINDWKEAGTILTNYSIIVYRRPGSTVDENIKGNKKILDAPLLEISSTKIRALIKEKKSIRYLVPNVVCEEIEKNNFYI